VCRRENSRNIAIEHPHVPDAVVDEGLLTGRRGTVAVEVVTHEPVRADAHALPANEGEDEVVREHEQEHREDEEVQVEEELAEVLLAVHVAVE
jgi:hypothetical protein